ncbi:32 kDa beta-galactoside-binding lectin-like, partial [Sinocyclocheilus grahami]|uniref:32 kDa beta-galactoside-binding lectin-like n=1 Tax=Sinocyclocheilus grahami TaxID=75366 RepID=UPI0007AC9CA6
MAASEQQLAIYKPTTTITSIKGGLQEGKRVIIIGRSLPDANRLHVNLQCGSDSDADIALHINPRYENDSAHVMYNTYKNGTWGSEQSTPDSPFFKDKLFAIEILVTKEAYKISANGKHLKDYEHHIPITQVNTISVDQNIELEFIGYQNSVPPYKKELINGLKPDKSIVIYGIPNPDCKSIAINLRHRYGVAFHYQCRFEENAVVRNTHENGSWGLEEKSEGIPFIQGKFFQAKISCKAEQYDVSVNGSNINLKDGSHPAVRTALCISPHFENDHPHIVYKTFQNDRWDSDQPTSKSPLLRGQLFTIKILVTTQAYKISANGEDLMIYNHHIPFTQMNTILVEGMELDFIGHLNLAVTSYKKEVVDGLKPGKIIVIYGIVNSDCKRMEINLRHRYGVAFHYLCCFEENAVVRNTWQDGVWGAEEKSQDIPFKNGEFFE